MWFQTRIRRLNKFEFCRETTSALIIIFSHNSKARKCVGCDRVRVERRGRFLPILERVEEEEAHVLEVVDTLPDELYGREVVAESPELPWTYVDGKFTLGLIFRALGGC